ncbi:MAG TPA: SdpI family protein [Dehalococcoidia bacterium]|nr:SdpI family protein [Dehalococcoidia bacterium]
MLGFLIVGVTIGAVVPSAIVGWLASSRRLPPNRWAGLNSQYTQSSEERWYAVHRVLGPYLLFGSIAALAVGLAFAPFVVAGEIPDSVAAIALTVELALLLGSTVAGSVVGTSRAKAELD